MSQPLGRPAGRTLTTRYLMTCAAIGAASGVLLIPANFVAVPLAVTLPVVYAAMVGLWAIAPVTALALVRRPGAALVTTFVAGVISSLSPVGASAVVTCLMVGVALEVVFAAALYRVWKPWLFLVAAVVCGGLYVGSYYWMADAGSMAPAVQATLAAVILASAVAFTVLGLVLARRLERTGVARGLAPRRTAAPAPVG